MMFKNPILVPVEFVSEMSDTSCVCVTISTTVFSIQGHKQRVLLWSVFSFSLLVVGYILEILGIPLSKALYTVSFMFITAGASGLVLTAMYYIVDIERLRKPTVLLQWMGMNALIVYALAACDIFPAIIQGFYWRSPENNL
ncbi:heparaN-alpha-glucosaminide N-acetyltransferase-like, partial [Trifolium medium]|nr:heparaN-alpha-glucosaminide N-acetyltransferase-like [Trifolium medium]